MSNPRSVDSSAEAKKSLAPFIRLQQCDASPGLLPSASIFPEALDRVMSVGSVHPSSGPSVLPRTGFRSWPLAGRRLLSLPADSSFCAGRSEPSFRPRPQPARPRHDTRSANQNVALSARRCHGTFFGSTMKAAPSQPPDSPEFSPRQLELVAALPKVGNRFPLASMFTVALLAMRQSRNPEAYVHPQTSPLHQPLPGFSPTTPAST